MRDRGMQSRLTKLGFAICLLWLAGCSPFSGSDLAPGVTRAAIRRLRLGMSGAQVRAILGEPLAQTAHTDSGGWSRLTYSRRVPGVRTYPMLWLTLEHDALTEAYAKQYVLWGVDDDGVYLLNARNPNGWASADFEKAFPR